MSKNANEPQEFWAKQGKGGRIVLSQSRQGNALHLTEMAAYNQLKEKAETLARILAREFREEDTYGKEFGLSVLQRQNKGLIVVNNILMSALNGILDEPYPENDQLLRKMVAEIKGVAKIALARVKKLEREEE